MFHTRQGSLAGGLFTLSKTILLFELRLSKTTSLYSALSELNKVGVNISTAEDPVEYNLKGVNQVQVNDKIDLTYEEPQRPRLTGQKPPLLTAE